MSEEKEKTRFVRVPRNASVLIVCPGQDDVGFKIDVDTPVPEDQVVNDLNQTPAKVCAVAVYTAGDWLANGHPSERDKPPKLWIPGVH